MCEKGINRTPSSSRLLEEVRNIVIWFNTNMSPADQLREAQHDAAIKQLKNGSRC